ncbi:hypothetical protein ACPCVL_05240 [Streptomyces koyangensis]|uniref:hypothetical protein n=1 Tax=Streptomyces koyangensis TaxID=188770 RepID=UPI003C3036F2
MSSADADGEERWAQRRVSVRGATLRLPRVLLAAALADLVWEIVKANLDGPVREEWPWRLVLLDASTCAALVALLTGILVTRSQLSQTMRPVLTWSGFEGHSAQLPHSRRTVTLANHGGGRAVVRSVAYRVRATGEGAEDGPADGAWLSWHQAVDALAALGLDRGGDFFLLHLGPGAAVRTAGTAAREDMEIAALNATALDRVAVLDIRIRVADVLGDLHERDLQCVRPRPRPPAPPDPTTTATPPCSGPR